MRVPPHTCLIHRVRFFFCKKIRIFPDARFATTSPSTGGHLSALFEIVTDGCSGQIPFKRDQKLINQLISKS